MVAAGATTSQISRIANGATVERVAPSTYRFTAAPASWMQALWIAVLSCGSNAVVSHRSAAALLGLDGFSPGPVEVTVPDAGRGRTPGITLHSSTRLARPDITEVNGLPVTSAARTIIDLAAIGASATEIGNAIDSAARLHLATGAYVQRRLRELGRPGRCGVQLIDEVMLDSGGHSFLERRFLKLVRLAKLPRPRTQVIHRNGRTTVARVDFEWTSQRLIVEVNGRRGHSSDSERAKDAKRRNNLQRNGFLVLEFTTNQVLDEPTYVVGSLTAVLAPTPLFR